MPLKVVHRSKANPALRRALGEARASQRLIVTMRLGTEKHLHAVEPNPVDYADQQSFNRATIEAQRKQVQAEIGDTVQALRKMALKLDGGGVTRTVVVKGSARRILEAMQLPGVRHAELDARFGLPDAG